MLWDLCQACLAECFPWRFTARDRYLRLSYHMCFTSSMWRSWLFWLILAFAHDATSQFCHLVLLLLGFIFYKRMTRYVHSLHRTSVLDTRGSECQVMTSYKTCFGSCQVGKSNNLMDLYLLVLYSGLREENEECLTLEHRPFSTHG